MIREPKKSLKQKTAMGNVLAFKVMMIVVQMSDIASFWASKTGHIPTLKMIADAGALEAKNDHG